MSTEVASQAGLCYNKLIKLFAQAMLETSLSRSYLNWRYDMDTLPPYAPYDKSSEKQCLKCGAIYPATSQFFHRDKSRKDGLFPWCKQCRYTFNKVPPEKNRLTQHRYDTAHKEEKKQYRQSPKAKMLRSAFDHKRRMQEQSVNAVTAQDIEVQLGRQKNKCYWCHKKLDKYHVDHVVPLSRDGSNSPENIVIACPTCNMRRRNKLPHEWSEGGRLL